MKKIITSLLCACAASIPAFSQTTEPQESPAVSGDSMVMVRASELDSLRSDLSTIKSELNEMDMKERRRGIWSRRRSWTIGYVNSTLSAAGAPSSEDLKSKFGVAMQFSNTYLLHPTPILGMIRIGIDAVWTDINYVKYKNNFPAYDLPGDYEYDPDYETQQVEIGMGIGPSINIAPFSGFSNGLRFLRAAVYFHATPSASIMIMDDESNAAFNLFMNVGLKLSYRRLSLGIEGRWGSAKYDLIDPEDYVDDDYIDYIPDDKPKLKTASLRAFISLNF